MNWTPIILAGVVFSVLSLAAAVASKGFLETDACTHYMFARFALREPDYLVSVWGRPLVTTLYAVPAALGGVLGVRVTSLLLALGGAAVTYRVANRQGYRWPELAFVFFLAQPLVFLHSFSELTELPFAVLLVCTFWAYQNQRWLLMAVLVALGPLGRPEGFGFLLLGAIALAAHRRWWWLLLLPIPLILWDVLGWYLSGRPQEIPWWNWLRAKWPYSSQSMYGSGRPWHFLIRLPVVTSAVMFPFMLLGLWWSLAGLTARKWLSPLRWEHRQRCQVLIALIPLAILAGHSFLWWQGLMASNGELRYMLAVGPFWALLIARGWQWAFERYGWRRPMLCAGVAALLPILANVYWRVIPLKLYEDDLLAIDVAAWYRGDQQLQRDYPRVMASFIGVYLQLDMSKSDRTRAMDWGQRAVQQKPPGTLLVWDAVFGQYNSDQNMCVTKEQILAAGWVPYPKALTRGEKQWFVFVSPLTASGQPTKVAPAP